MKLGIVGAGNLGTGLTRQLVKKGHAVMLSFSKDEAKLKDSARSLGVKVGTPAEAASFADVVVLTTRWTATAAALKQAGALRGRKVLWDCTNALKPDMSGLLIGTTTSGGEEVAKLAPWAKVVKAIPPFAEMLHSSSPTIDGALTTVFVCGDDREARSVVSSLVDQVGAQRVDAGPLRNAHFVEPAMMLLVQLAYPLGMGPVGIKSLRTTELASKGSWHESSDGYQDHTAPQFFWSSDERAPRPHPDAPRCPRDEIGFGRRGGGL